MIRAESAKSIVSGVAIFMLTMLRRCEVATRRLMSPQQRGEKKWCCALSRARSVGRRARSG